MQTKTLIVLIAAAIVGISSTAMAKGGGGKGGGGGHFHGHFHNHFHFDNRFLRNQALLNGWGWGWGDYGDNGYGNNTTVVVFPQAKPEAATGSTSAPCGWNTDTFKVPSSAGGTRAVEVVACR